MLYNPTQAKGGLEWATLQHFLPTQAKGGLEWATLQHFLPTQAKGRLEWGTHIFIDLPRPSRYR
ncbi:MAG: hypothetical protein ACRD28_06095, partial [Acidobacteriaceae bacterium]